MFVALPLLAGPLIGSLGIIDWLLRVWMFWEESIDHQQDQYPDSLLPFPLPESSLDLDFFQDPELSPSPLFSNSTFPTTDLLPEPHIPPASDLS